ncbi:MAG: alpha-amylase family glycosyl hydrolase [Candidatus Hadarchaeales archaeon]
MTNGAACYAENILSGRKYVYAHDTRHLYRYDIAADLWENIGPLPAQAFAGSGMVWTKDNYIYMTRGGSGTPNFWRYNIPENKWETLANTPVYQYSGSCIAWGGGSSIYAILNGSSENGLYVYSITSNTWTKLYNLPYGGTPPPPASGSSLVAVGGFLYYAPGGTNQYWRYRISDNTWTQLASAPASWGAGGAQEVINENYIYAVRGGTTTSFYRYNVVTNTWESLTALPATVSYANDRLSFDGAFLYMIRATSDNQFWRYAPAWWENLSPWPGIVGSTVACYAENILSGKRYIYALESKSDPAWLYRYDIATGVWENLGTKPGVGTAAGSSMVWTGGRYLYVLRGGTTTAPNFYRYDIVENSWTTLAPTGTSQLSGSCLAWDGGDNIYAAIRSTSPADNFLKVYKISTNTWENIIMLPENAASGSSICKVENFIYYQVGGTKRYWRYSIVDNSWSRLADVPESSGAGGSQEKVGDKYIYFVVGGGSRNVYRFVISENRWENVSSFPATVTNANDRLAFDGTYLYMIRGATDSSFWRYSVKTIPAYSLKWQQTIPLTLYESPEQTYAQPYSLSLLAGGVTSLDNIKFADDKPASFSQRRYIYVYENKGRGTENTTSTSFVDLENARVSVSVTDNSYLIINFHAAHNSSMAGDKVEFRIMVGTYVVAYGHGEMGVASQDTTISLTRAWRVPPGNYTVRAQWRRASGSGTLWCWERNITVWVVPENAFRVFSNREWSTVYASDSFSDLSGMVAQISVSEDSYLFMNFHASFDHAGAGGKVEFKLMVDEENVAYAYGMTATAGQDLMVSLTRAYQVSRGTHTVKVQWRRASGTGTVACWERSLNVVVIPVRALSVWSNRNTETSSTSGSTWVSLPGASLSFSTPRESTLAVQFHASFNVNASGNKPEFRIILDGDESNPLAIGYGYMATTSQDTTIRLVAMSRVSAGAHTIAVQWRVASGTGTAYCWEKSINAVALENLFDFELLGEISNIPLADRYTLEMKYRLSSDSDGFVVYVKSPQPLVTDNTVALWRFDEGSGVQVLESSGNGQTGLIYGVNVGVLWSSDSVFGYSLNFTGLGGYVLVPHSSILAPPAGFSQLTVSAWIKVREVSGHHTIVTKRSYVWEPTNGWQMYVEPATDPGKAKFCVILKSTGEGYYGVAIDNAVNLNEWTHVAFTYDNNGVIRVYINGVDRTSEDSWNSRGGAGNVLSAPDNLFIGCINGTSEWFIGWIDEVRIENRVLTSEEMAIEASLERLWRKVGELRGTDWQSFTRVVPANSVENGRILFRIVDIDPFSKSQSVDLDIDYIRVSGYRLWENLKLRIYGCSMNDAEKVFVYVWNGREWEIIGTLPQGSPGWLTANIPYLYAVGTSDLKILYKSEDDNDETMTKVCLDYVGIGEGSSYSTSVEAYILLSLDGENWQEYGPFTTFPVDLSSLPPARFVRYRLKLFSDRENMTPIVRNVEIKVAAYTADENIAWGGIFFNSFSEDYLSPNGIVLRKSDGSRANAVLATENITIRIRAFRGDLTAVKLHVITDSGENVWEMSRTPSGAYDFWTKTFQMRANENWSYFFEIRDGDTVGYYADDSLKDGGSGRKYDSEQEARSNAFRIHAQALPTDPQGMVIYEVMVDRFYDGDPSNNNPSQSPGLYDPRRENGNWKYYWGGDLKGLIQKLDYIAGMGVSAIWITPIVNNIDRASEYDNSTGYHGYWAKDFKQIEEHFGTWQDVYDLVSEARKRNIRIIMDWAPNHTSPAYWGENGALYDNGVFWTDYRREWFTDAFWARENSTVSTTSTTFVDLSGMALDVFIHENSYLLINFHAAHNINTWGKAEFLLLVGDTEVAKGYSHMGLGDGQDTTVSLTRAYFVTPGKYTVKAQWRLAEGTGTVYCWERSLSVMVVPAYWIVRDNRATDWVTTTSTSFVDIPNMASTVTVTENSYLLVNFHISHNVDHSSGDGKAEFQIQVGTENIAMGYSNSPWKQDLTLSLTAIRFVTPGTYTVKARWRSVNGYTLGAWERSLNVVAIPTRALKVENIRSTTLTSTTSSTWTSLPNASLSISVPENVVLAINFHAGFNNNTSGAKPQFMLRVDGNPVGVGYSRMAMASQDTTFRLVAAIPVSAGSHTIDVQWRIENGIGIAYCWERSLNVVAVTRNFNEFTWSWENIFRHNGDIDMQAQDDRWNIRYRNLLQLADLNQLNPRVDNYLKEALKLFLDAGIGGLRIDAAKHMDPGWLKTLADFVYSGWENIYIMHESVVEFWDETYWDVCQFDNNYGMHMINTALAFIIRDVFGWKSRNMYELEYYVNKQFSFPASDILWNQKVVNAVACHDWSRFRSMNKSMRDSELAIGFVLTLPGIPLVYYGEEQYMYNDNINPNNEIGGDPYNRGMMVAFDNTTTYYRLVRKLADLRKLNPALRYGIISTKYVSENVYVFQRKFFNDVVLVAINLGGTDVNLTNISVEMPDDTYSDYLGGILGNGRTITVQGGVISSLTLPASSMGVWYCLTENNEPWLGAIDPVMGRAGNKVRVSGKGFGKTQGQVIFDNGTQRWYATIIEWADDHVYFQVPSGVVVPINKQHVEVFVKRADGKESNRILFQYLKDKLVLVVHRLDNTKGTELETTMGEFLFITGSVAEYSNWSDRSENAVGPMLCPYWDNWFVVTAVPRSTYIEFKFIKARLGESGSWESGSNHTFTSPENGVLYRRSRPGGGASGFSLPPGKESGVQSFTLTSSENVKTENENVPPLSQTQPSENEVTENEATSSPAISISSSDSGVLSWFIPENVEVARYEVMIDDDPSFSSPIIISVVGNSLDVLALGLEGGQYFWRVRAILSDGTEILSEVGMFEIKASTKTSQKPLWILPTGIVFAALISVFMLKVFMRKRNGRFLRYRLHSIRKSFDEKIKA